MNKNQEINENTPDKPHKLDLALVVLALASVAILAYIKAVDAFYLVYCN